MAITSAICSSFKQELLQGKHSFESSGGHTFKLALFDSDASLGAATTDYSTSEEITNTSGTAYTAGGATLTNQGVSLSSTTAFTDFADVLKHLHLSLQMVQYFIIQQQMVVQAQLTLFV